MPAAELRGFMNVDSPASRAALVQRGEVLQRHVHLAAHLQQRRRVATRSGIAPIVRRLCVTSSPISPLPRVAPRSSTPSRYTQADRQAVDLRLHHEREAADPRSPRARGGCASAPPTRAAPPRERTLPSDSIGSRCAHLLQAPHRLAAHPLGGRVGRQRAAGGRASIARSSSSRRSYASSPISGSSRT